MSNLAQLLGRYVPLTLFVVHQPVHTPQQSRTDWRMTTSLFLFSPLDTHFPVQWRHPSTYLGDAIHIYDLTHKTLEIGVLLGWKPDDDMYLVDLGDKKIWIKPRADTRTQDYDNFLLEIDWPAEKWSEPRPWQYNSAEPSRFGRIQTGSGP
jgi:hypothetical protein